MKARHAVFAMMTLCYAGCSESVADTVPHMTRSAPRDAAPASGPLRIHSDNPRYFSDGSGKAIYLTGSHHWNNLIDNVDSSGAAKPFPYLRYLEFLESHRHNFIRMWAAEGGENGHAYDPLPYVRTGPGMALDGRPKFDLDQFNPAYFDRLRSRVRAAADRGIYVSIMLFNGWTTYDHGHGKPWPLHPFNIANNVNAVDGDVDGDGDGRELYTFAVPGIVARQQAYIRRVIETVNDLDNVLYEITNETAIFSKDWQYRMIHFIHEYERTKPKQHPVGMTSFDTSPADAARDHALDALWNSPADWISPCNDGTADYATNPPPPSHGKVVVSDTDHIFGVGGDHNWVWKTFTRGLHPVYMDPIQSLTQTQVDPPEAVLARKAMGDTRSYAGRMDLAAMAPRTDVCSTTYCLAKPGSEYLVYLPFGSHWFERWIDTLPRRIARRMRSRNWVHRAVTLEIPGSFNELHIEWLNPLSGEIVTERRPRTDPPHEFVAPFRGDAVLYVAGR